MKKSQSCKPDSVPPACGRDDHSSARPIPGTAGWSRLDGAGRASSPIWSCTGMGLPPRPEGRWFATACRQAVRWALAPPFHPCRPKPAVWSLWRSPGRRVAPRHPPFQTESLPCGVWTFLPACAGRPSAQARKKEIVKYINVISV